MAIPEGGGYINSGIQLHAAAAELADALAEIEQTIDAVLRGQHDGWDRALDQMRDKARAALARAGR